MTQKTFKEITPVTADLAFHLQQTFFSELKLQSRNSIELVILKYLANNNLKIVEK